MTDPHNQMGRVLAKARAENDRINLDALIAAVEAGGELLLGDFFVLDRLAGTLDECGCSAAGAFNGSLDAAKALHDALLPGHFWFIGHLDAPELGYAATVASGHFPDSPSWRGYNLCPARAWLLAILKVYRATMEEGK